MVKIIYYADPTGDSEIIECNSVSEFLLSRFNTRDELLDLRFFDGDILSHEIDQSDGEFLSINEGTVAITHDSMIPRTPDMWIYVAIAAIVAVTAAILLRPSIPEIDTGRDQQSGTNKLGDSNNEPRVNERIDDIFGTVAKHTPPLWQVPYKIGVDNQEVEVLLLCVGRGRYEIDLDRWYDGDTPVKNIPNASVNIYEPYKNPNVDMPDQVIGDIIDEEIGIYRQSNDLNPSELQAPNTLQNAGLKWRITGSGGNGVMRATEIPDSFDFIDYYNVGDRVKLTDFYHRNTTGSITLYQKSDTSKSTTFATFDKPVDLSDGNTLEYQILSVTSDSITVEIPTTASAEVVSAWSNANDYLAPEFTALLVAPTIPSGTYIGSPVINNFSYVVSDGETWFDVLTDEALSLNPIVGEFVENVIGPVFIPEKATKAIFNFVSPNGFYKVVEGKEIAVYASVLINVYELDVNGDETGNMTPYYVPHISNPSLTRLSVFNTYTLELPYTRNKVTVERVTDRDDRENVSNVDTIEWRDLYSFEPVSVTDFGDVTLAHVYTPSNSQSQLVKQRKQNADVTRLITEYQGNGVFGPAETYATNDFSQILIHTALDPYIGRLSLDNINADGFLEVRDEINTYFGSSIMSEFGYDFDTTDLTYQDTFMRITDAVMCIPYAQNGVYDIFFDKKQTVSSMQVTCRNKIMDSETRRFDYDRKHDGVEVVYRDNDTGVQETIYIPSDQSARNPERKELSGVTNAIQAQRHGYRMFNRQKYEIEYTQFEVDEFGRNIIPNKRIDSPDSTRFTLREGVTDGYRVYDGEVVEVNGLNVELSEPFEFTDGEDHYITFTKLNGDNSEPILCTQIDEFTVSLSTMPSEPIYDGYEKDRTKYVLVSEQLKESVALIPKTIEFNLNDDGTETHTISCVNYTDKYYQNDLDELE